jgi:hypothetical protein
LHGIGGGAGLGASISIPFINASGSADQFPSAGLGSIFRGFSAPDREFEKNDFTGNLIVASVGGGTYGTSTQWSLAMWLK